jgi:Cu(I)/Ag(I) efflux system membrane fusion protein
LQARLEMPNPNLRLKPDMFVNVELSAGASARLVVPVNAVLNSGLRQTVFVDRGNGYLEPRRVRTGQANSLLTASRFSKDSARASAL